MTRNFAITFLAILAGALAVALFATFARAHEAPSGWEYDQKCCDGRDCGQVPDASVIIQETGYFVVLTAGDHQMVSSRVEQFIPFGSREIKISRDQKYHACIVAPFDGMTWEDMQPYIRCLYVPPQGF